MRLNTNELLAFAQALSNLHVEFLREVLLCLQFDPPMDHLRQGIDALKLSESSLDSLSISLRQLSLVPNPVHIYKTRAVVSPKYFLAEEDTTPCPNWTRLKTFHVTLSGNTPSGEWLYNLNAPSSLRDSKLCKVYLLPALHAA
jgi:hypothetical protein